MICSSWVAFNGKLRARIWSRRFTIQAYCHISRKANPSSLASLSPRCLHACLRTTSPQCGSGVKSRAYYFITVLHYYFITSLLSFCMHRLLYYLMTVLLEVRVQLRDRGRLHTSCRRLQGSGGCHGALQSLRALTAPQQTTRDKFRPRGVMSSSGFQAWVWSEMRRASGLGWLQGGGGESGVGVTKLGIFWFRNLASTSGPFQLHVT